MKNEVFSFLVVMFVLASTLPSKAQETCASDFLLEKHVRENSGLSSYISEYIRRLNHWITNYPINPQLHRNPVTIPVVVHVIYKNATENIPTSTIQAQISALSNDYRKRNGDVSTVPEVFRRKAADTYIQFKLATRDPSGNPTTGITRTSTTRPYFQYELNDMKMAPNGVVPWDTDRYLNIWVCDVVWSPNGGIQNTLNGYGTFPWDSVAIHGVVMDFTQFGSGTPYPPDRTWSHEVGHFLGLWHIWRRNGCSADDEVSDTPKQDRSNSGCPSFPSLSCSNGPNGDMFMNIMDYTADNCRRMITKGQRARMLGNLAPGKSRASLAVSNGIFPPNAVSKEYTVFLEGQNSQLPSWKAALAMVHGWACSCSPNIPALVSQNAGQSGRHIAGIPNEVSEVIHALALTPQEILMCYSIDGFYRLLDRPVALLTLRGNQYYGLVVHGIVMDNNAGTARLKIKDPMNIGPREFLFDINQSGSEYTVDYNEFMTENLERLAAAGKKIFIVSPPAQENP